MAKRTTKKKAKAPSITDLAKTYDTHASRRKIGKAKYEPVLALFLEFAQGRARGDHTCSLQWFVEEGIDQYNQGRPKSEQVFNDLTVGPFREWLSREHPKLRDAFRR